MGKATGADRCFLFLQGPHGPFFNRLGKMLRTAGAQVWRVGFNAGDRAFWSDKSSYIAFEEPQENWPDRFAAIVAEKDVTDIVLYGDTRFIHAEAVKQAKAAGLTVHVFEEGYLRPYWVTYERGGSNGHSRLMDMSIDDMRKVLAGTELTSPEAPAHWGDMRQHVFYGALYHWFVMFRNGAYRHFKPHRDLGVVAEFRLYLRRLLMMPAHRVSRRVATKRIMRGGYPYHLALLQLEHDSSFQAHSPFGSMSEFLELVIAGFAKGAPTHHHLVFKAHPLENGRLALRRLVHELAEKHGVGGRVHYVPGGKLAQLLDHARSAVTVNSTAALQVLRRGIPLKVFGVAVFDKPELVSTLPLDEFFGKPDRPDIRAYKEYRQYLLETSQIPGGFYSARGRDQLMRLAVDMVLASQDPYDALKAGNAAPRQQLHIVN
ncbi:capsule biosynthesis protein [Profundibacter amoris]|uniref:Capsular biosynthesis protein n=1 Tax=Profundibacter amoris TaxID=2171755 RepID=A0A347UEQ6_9RHOB|nr:capsular biosynthesis protein [Profundibacter amoris]AXX97334.1 capsular biosynthesis protein [Profundibacter amoris]